MNKLYKEFYKQRLFTLEEANALIKNYQVCKNNIQRMLKKDLIKALKPGLYYIVPLDDEHFYPNPLHIASKLRDNAVISCNSALYAHNIYREENTIYLFSKYNSKLRLNTTTYKILKNKHKFGIEEYNYQTNYAQITIKVTDIERTLIDCLRTRTIKFIELLALLKSKTMKMDMSKILAYLEKYKMSILYNKTGLLLELLETNLVITDNDLEKLRKKLSKKVYYMREKGLKVIKPKYKYDKTWNIMMTEELWNYIKSQKKSKSTETNS